MYNNVCQLPQAKVYVQVKEWGDDCNTIDVVYPVFFPYNFYHDVCAGIDPNGNCLGELK